MQVQVARFALESPDLVALLEEHIANLASLVKRNLLCVLQTFYVKNAPSNYVDQLQTSPNLQYVLRAAQQDLGAQCKTEIFILEPIFKGRIREEKGNCIKLSKKIQN